MRGLRGPGGIFGATWGDLGRAGRIRGIKIWEGVLLSLPFPHPVQPPHFLRWGEGIFDPPNWGGGKEGERWGRGVAPLPSPTPQAPPPPSIAGTGAAAGPAEPPHEGRAPPQQHPERGPGPENGGAAEDRGQPVPGEGVQGGGGAAELLRGARLRGSAADPGPHLGESFPREKILLCPPLEPPPKIWGTSPSHFEAPPHHLGLISPQK